MNSVRQSLFAQLVFAFTAASALAQIGSNNPTGVAGQFGGNSTTAGSYDPYTANATRVVTDLAVAAVVGNYPLVFSRIANSRGGSTFTPGLGTSGGWRHSYQWDMPGTDEQFTAALPTSFVVNYPDGRSLTFAPVAGDSYYRAGSGVRDRFKTFDVNNLGYVVLPDGGKVEFKATLTTVTDGETHVTSYWWKFKALALIDSHGLRTTFTYDAGGKLSKVTEPAGRYLTLTWGSTTWANGGLADKIITQVSGSDGRSVTYAYVKKTYSPSTFNWTALDTVTYFGDATLKANYTYVVNNISSGGIPLLSTCIDPMFGGPMWRIAYTFRTTNNPDGTAPISGQLSSENFFDGTTVGAALATLSVNNNTRTETRGDGPSRTFSYTGYFLTSITDFKGAAATQAYDSNGFLNSVTDRNGHAITATRQPLTGAILVTTYPATADVTPSPAPAITTTVTYGSATCPDVNNRDINNPYYSYSTTDGAGNTTVYLRDTNKRVIRINYANGAFETLSYNSFGQVLTHGLMNGGSEAFTYDLRGLPIEYRDAVHATGNPTARYQYDGMDRGVGVTDALGASAGDSAHTVTSTYSIRGQLTKVTHSDGTYLQYAYNTDGTLAWTADELHTAAITDATQRTAFTYDAYRRTRTVTTPLRFAGDTTARVSSLFYDSNGTGEDVLHTLANVSWVTSPNGRRIHNEYDENYRQIKATAAPGISGEEAVTTFSYDPVGNLLTAKRPNQQLGGVNAGTAYAYFYDEMNRLYAFDDPIAADRNTLGHTMNILYDPAGRKGKVTRADDHSASWTYNNMNWVTQTTGFANENTLFTPDTAGRITQLTDANSHFYGFGYDTLNRKTSATFPTDASGVARSEAYDYDTANRLWHYTNTAGEIKTLTYDARHRITNSSWSGSGPAVTVAYDAASNISSLANTVGSSVVTTGFTYDGANNKIFETQTLNDGTNPVQTHIVQAHLDADGLRSDLAVNTGGTISGNIITGGTPNYGQTYDYNNRNELKNIYTQAGAPFFQYTYDPNGNVMQRLGRQANDPMGLSYDAMDRPILCWHGGTNGTQSTAFATSHYGYDKLGNIQDTFRDEQGGKGERYIYDLINQLTGVSYNADGVQTQTPSNATRTVSYVLDTINRQSVTDKV